MKRDRRLRYGIAFTVLAILLIILLTVNIKYGSVDMTVKDIMEVFAGKGDITVSRIIMDIRLPRVMAALV